MMPDNYQVVFFAVIFFENILDQPLIDIPAETAFRRYQYQQFLIYDLLIRLPSAKMKQLIHPYLGVYSPQFGKKLFRLLYLVFDLRNTHTGDAFEGAGQADYSPDGIAAS